MWVLFLLSKCFWAPYANLLILWSPVNFKFHISVFSHIYTTYGYSLSFSFLFLSPRNFSQLVCIWFYSSSGSLPFLGHAVCFLLLLHQFCISALYPHRDTNQGRGRTFFVWLEPWDGPPKSQNVRQWDPVQFLCEVSKGQDTLNSLEKGYEYALEAHLEGMWTLTCFQKMKENPCQIPPILLPKDLEKMYLEQDW